MSIGAVDHVSIYLNQTFSLQMESFTKYHRFVVGLGAFAGAAVYYLNTNKPEVFNSWTTNHTLSSPLAKWDENWDQ